MTKKKWIAIVGIVLSTIIFLEIYIRHDHPPFIQETIQALKENDSLMASIGEYKNYEYNFNKSDLKRDTMAFSIQIVGINKKLIYTGKAVKGSEQNWTVIEKDTVIHDNF